MAPRNAPAASAVPATREPVTERGADLLALVDHAEQDEDNADGGLRLTQEEALEGINAGHLQADPSTADENGAAVVTLTEAGKASLSTGPGGETQVSGSGTPVGGGGYTIRTDIPVPTITRKRRTSENAYPFATMPLNGTFHVAKTAENPDPYSKIASSVSVARSRFSEPTDEMETVTKKEYQKNENGKGFKTDEAGKRIVLSEQQVTQPKRRLTRDFVVAEVDATDPEGPGARVWRTL